MDLAEKSCDRRVVHTRRYRRGAQYLTHIREHLMTGVQNADLHGFVHMHMAGDGGANMLPLRPPRAKSVFDHPLPKVLMRDGRGVVDSERLGRGNLLRAGGRNNAVDHRIGERSVVIDPLSKFGIRELGK